MAASPLYALTRPLVFALPPEAAHEAILRALEAGLYLRDPTPPDPRLAITVAGTMFSNPIGVAAGFDKDGRVPDAVLGLGAGFAEVGTITPLPQDGNPRPRVFRLVAERALINRLGFNNGGHAAALARLTARAAKSGIVGVNVGANKDSPDRVGDYVTGIATFYDVASYFMVNISSPNTTGLRSLQDPANLDALLQRVMAVRAERVSGGAPRRPILVKIAPDLADDDIAPVCERLLAHGVDGIAVSNTTLSRDGVSGRISREGGGLSGRPLFERSTVMLARVYQATEGKLPLVGIGGVDSGPTVRAKIAAGASLVQLYTGLVYEGPGLIGALKRDLSAWINERGVDSIADLVGSEAEAWAAARVSPR
jgi:dihydroorotate dehydrogenase